MKKLLKISGSCVLCALHHVSGIDEETVLRVCQLHNFTPGSGMEDADWLEAAKDLGINLRAATYRDCRLKQFVKNYPIGLYLVGTRDHLFVLDNGLIVDPREKMAGRYPGLGRVVKQAWKVIKDAK